MEAGGGEEGGAKTVTGKRWPKTPDDNLSRRSEECPSMQESLGASVAEWNRRLH